MDDVDTTEPSAAPSGQRQSLRGSPVSAVGFSYSRRTPPGDRRSLGNYSGSCKRDVAVSLLGREQSQP